MKMKKILVIDNYDSFTYNLVHILRELGLSADMVIRRNDEFQLSEVDDFESILLSPGPGVPSQAGLMPEVIKQYGATKNILGVCLGHQGIGEAYGAELHNLKQVFHGVTSKVKLTGKDELFEAIPEEFEVCRYHSWVIKSDGLPENIIVTAVDPEGTIMAIRHKEYNVRGVQFHPESIMTEHGKKLIENWIQLA